MIVENFIKESVIKGDNPISYKKQLNKLKKLKKKRKLRVILKIQFLKQQNNGIIEAVKWFIERGADIEAKNNHGDTPLTSADRYNETKIVEIINYYNNKAKLKIENN